MESCRWSTWIASGSHLLCGWIAMWQSKSAHRAVCWVYHKLYLSRAFCPEHPAWIALYGGFARFVVRRRCSFCQHSAVRTAVYRRKGESRTMPSLASWKCEIFKRVSVLRGSCYMYITRGLFQWSTPRQICQTLSLFLGRCFVFGALSYWYITRGLFYDRPIVKIAKLLNLFLEGWNFEGVRATGI